MNKVITSPTNLQAFYKKDFTPDLSGVESIDVLFREKLSILERRVFSYFCKTQLIYDGRVYISQEVVAANFGISREWLNKIVGKLKRLGLLDSYYRHMQTSLYRVSPYFDDLQVRYLLRHLVGAFYFTLDLLKSQLQKPLSRNSSHNNINKRYIYNPCNNYVVKNELIPPQGRDRKMVSGNFKTKKVEIPQHVSAIVCIPLTLAGQIKLSAFDVSTIKYALSQFKLVPGIKNKFGPEPTNQPGIKNKFSYFMKICLNYCKEHKVRPDWDLVAQLKAQYHIPLDAEMTFANNPKTTPIQTQKKPAQPTSEYLVPKIDYPQEQLKHQQWKLSEDYKNITAKFPWLKLNPFE